MVLECFKQISIVQNIPELEKPELIPKQIFSLRNSESKRFKAKANSLLTRILENKLEVLSDIPQAATKDPDSGSKWVDWEERDRLRMLGEARRDFYWARREYARLRRPHSLMTEEKAKILEEEERIASHVEARVKEIKKKEEEDRKKSAKKFRSTSTQTDDDDELHQVYVFLKELTSS